MEECNRKRARDDSEADSPESKRVIRVDSDSDDNSSESQLKRVNSAESCVDSDGYKLAQVETDSSEINEIQDDLLNILDDTETVPERETTTTTVQGLDSVMKSFEDEILAPGQDLGSDPNLGSESGEFMPNLGYLLEASDDELGLPPTVAPSEVQEIPEISDSGRVGPELMDMPGLFWFEEDFRNYEGFGLVGYDVDENGGGYVTIDGLFDYAEPVWRSESLPAM